jgi:lysophospholipase L1-like esterase
MTRPHPRVLALGLALLAALAGWHWRDRLPGFDQAKMVDAACPERPVGEEWKPVRYDRLQLCRYRADNARLLASGQAVRAVVLGDSISERWAVDESSPFGGGVANRAISGQTSQDLVLRFRQDVLGLRPQVVVFQGGLNDMIGLGGLSDPAAFIANFETLIDLAQAHDIVPVVASLPPVESVPRRSEIAATGRVVELNHHLKALAARRGTVYADFFTPLAGPGGKPRPGMTLDGMHPSPAGYAALRPAIERALAEAEARVQTKEP